MNKLKFWWEVESLPSLKYLPCKIIIKKGEKSNFMLEKLAETTSLNQVKSNITSNDFQIKPMLVSPDERWKEKNQGHLCDLLPKLHNFILIMKYNNPNWRTFYQIASLQYSKMSLLWKSRKDQRTFGDSKMFKGSWWLWSCMTTYHAWFWNELFSYKGLYRDNWENLNGNWGGTNVWISASWMAVL